MPTTFTIDDIENDLKGRLDLKLADKISTNKIEVELMPDDLNGFRRPIMKKTRISICYLDTDFDRTKSPEVVAQDATNKFGFFISSKNRRGADGVNESIHNVLKYLVGFKPLGHEKMTAVKVELYEREKDTNLWFARVELAAKYMQVEFNDDPAPPPIVEMKFNPPSFGGSDQVVVNENTQTSETSPIS
jgi:hypothetical protein